MDTEMPKNRDLNPFLLSIKNDRHIFRWFLRLIFVPAVKQQLAGNEKMRALYRRLSIITCSLNVIHIIIALYYIYIWKSEVFTHIPALLLLVGIGLILYRRKKHTVYLISSAVLAEETRHHPLGGQTLYQFGEYYGKKYGIPPIVDMITGSDGILRRTVLFTIVFTTLIFPFFLSWQSYALLVANFYLAFLISNSLL